MALRTVLCPVDFTPLSAIALNAATGLCAGTDARLVIEHNVNPVPPLPLGISWMWSRAHADDRDDLIHTAARKLREAMSGLPGSIEREAVVSRGPVDVALLHLARDFPADLIVMGSHGWSGPGHRSLTERIIARAPCPVLTVNERCGPVWLLLASLRLLVPVDFSAHSLRAAELAADLAACRSGLINLLHVLDHGSFERRREAMRRLRSGIPRTPAGPVRCHVLQGRPDDVVRRFARRLGCHLIVVGCHRTSKAARLFRTPHSWELLHRCDTPILFIPLNAAVPALRREAAA